MSAEKRLLTSKARALRTSVGGAKKGMALGAGIVGLLWIATLVASEAPSMVVTLFWIAVGGGILLWVRRDLARDSRYQAAMADGLDSARRADGAEVFDVRARRYAEFEEVEDEGACYAFEIGEGRVVFIVGQPFYPAARFPSLDFSIVYALDETGVTVDFWIEKRGERTKPDRVISAAVKRAVEIPEHLKVVHANLDWLEDVLPGA